jgi:hypothetical protein
MKLLRKIFSWTLTYKIFAFIESLYYYLRDYFYIKDTFYSREFKIVIAKYIRCQVEKDWLGRLYGIINPYIDINGKLDISSMIVELDGSETNNEEQLKVWIYKQIQLIYALFNIEKLGDYISLDIEHVGPENHDNYLITFDIISRKYFGYCFKKMMKQMLIYLLLAFGVLIFITL